MNNTKCSRPQRSKEVTRARVTQATAEKACKTRNSPLPQPLSSGLRSTFRKPSIPLAFFAQRPGCARQISHHHNSFAGMSGCARATYAKKASFNFEGKKKATCCKEHADQGTVNVFNKRCLRPSCIRRPCYNFDGSKTAAYCRLHARGDRVDVLSKRCSRECCTMRPS